MDNRKLRLVEYTEPNDIKQHMAMDGELPVAIFVDVFHEPIPREVAAEIVRRYNAHTALVEALKALVQTIEWQAEANFLNEDADEGNENSLTKARALLETLKD